jgi:hypothetical protein
LMRLGRSPVATELLLTKADTMSAASAIRSDSRAGAVASASI